MSITPRTVATKEVIGVLPYDGSGNRVQVTSIQSGNDEQTFKPVLATQAGTFTLSFGGQTTAPISYTAGDPTLVASFHGIPVTPGVAINISLTVAQSIGFTAKNVLCEVIEGTFVRDSANFNQENIAASPDFTTVNDQNGGAGLSSWLTLFPGYVPTSSSLSIRMTAPITATPPSQSIWVADGLHVREVVSGIVTIYDDSDPAHFSATGFTGSSVCCYGQYYNGTFHAFPFGSGTGSACTVDAADAQAKFQALSNVGSGNALVTAIPNGINIEFVGTLGAAAQPDITSTSPAIVSSHTIGGFVPTLHVAHQGGATEDVHLRQAWPVPTATGLSWGFYPFDMAHLGFTIVPTDVLTITIPDGWMNTAGGPLAAGTYPVENHSADDNLMEDFTVGPKTMGIGQNLQQDVFYSEAPTFLNLAVRSGLAHVGPLGDKVVLAWDSNGDPTLMSAATALAIVVEPPQGSNDGVGGILPLIVPNGVYAVKYDGPFAGLGIGGQHCTITELMQYQVVTNTVDNVRAFNIQAIQSQQAAPRIDVNYLASGAADGNGNFPCATKNIRVYRPDPADATGMTPWLNPPGRFDPTYLAKCRTLRTLRPMQAYDTFFNPIADFAQYKQPNWLDRSSPQVTRRVNVSRVEQYTGTPLDNPHTIVLKITTLQPHGFFTGQSITLEHCGTANLSRAVLVNGVSKASFDLGETGDLATCSVDVIDANTFAWHSLKTTIQSGPDVVNVDGVTMTNVLNKGDAVAGGGVLNGAARGPVGTSWALQDAVDLLVELKAAYPMPARRRMWFNLPVSATDACIDALGAFWAANLPAGFELCAEFGNECWNFNYGTYSWLRARNFQVNGDTGDTYAKAYAQGQINVNTRFQAAFTSASRTGDFVHVFASQSSDTANTGIIASYAHSVSARADEFAFAPYIANYNNGAVDHARANLMTVGMHLAALQLNTENPGYLYTANQQAVIQPYYPSAKIVAYEGGPESLILGLAGNSYLYSNVWPLQHAIHRHPLMYKIMLRLLQSFQDAGITLYTNFDLFGGSQLEAWSTWEWWNQQPGTGNPDENPDYRNTSALTSGGQVPVVSQVGGAIDFWNSLVGSSPSTLTPGTATAGSTTNTTASATATEATLGTAPYAHQWFRSTIVGQTGALVAGQAGLTLADTGLTPGITYYYKLRYTDSATPTPAVVYSNQIILSTTGGGPAPSLSQSTATISVGQSITLTASNFTGGAVTWASTDTSKATVVSGLVTGVLAGSATITATGVTDVTQTATCVVTVTPAFVEFVLIGNLLGLSE